VTVNEETLFFSANALAFSSVLNVFGFGTVLFFDRSPPGQRFLKKDDPILMGKQLSFINVTAFSLY